MNQYSYFPGCSLAATAIAYGLSIDAVTDTLGIRLTELDGWTCCGSTAYSSFDELESVCIAARNLALAEKTGLELVTPCSACYSTFKRAESHFKTYPELRRQVTDILQATGLEYAGKVKIRHLVDVLLNDVPQIEMEARVVAPLEGLKVAPYYGCQLVRPDSSLDDPEYPHSLTRLITTLGAEVTPFPLRSRCCGASLIISERDVALGMIRELLESAQSNGAECIVTVCPLCQTNLDVYQGMVNSRFGTSYELPVFFLTQLMGLAFGIWSRALGLDKNMVSPGKVLTRHVTATA
jgi:heterodisulfide reductase subunit B